jgi:hypothetical protein
MNPIISRISINKTLSCLRAGASFSFSCLFTFLGSSAVAQDFIENTYLIDIRTGSARSDIARNLSLGGYELSDGAPVNFADWYRPNFPELNFLFLTQIRDSLGVTWGLSLGERGEKYRINPGVWMGFVYRAEIDKFSSLTLSATTLVGGNFRERSCFGDYKDIGGIQEVNCRLAASTLPPADTLKFLVREYGYSETRFSVQYEIRF